MIRLVGLFVWLNWKELRNQFRFRRRTDQAEQLSRILGVVVSSLLGLVLLAAMTGVAYGAWYAAKIMARGEAFGGKLDFILQFFILMAMGSMVIMIPIGASQAGSAASSARFALLPISRRRLHLIEILSGVGNFWILILGTGCSSLALGLLAAGRGGAALAAAVAGLALVALFALFGGVLGFLTQWLFRDRGRGELIVLVLMVALLGFSAVAPLMDKVEIETGDGQEHELRGVRLDLRGLFEPEVMGWLPGGLYMGAVRNGAGGRPAAAAAAAAGLLLQAALLYGISARLYAAVMDKPSGGRRRRRSRKGSRLLVLPGVPPPVAAVAQAQIRTALRTVRGKLAVLSVGYFVLAQAAFLRGTPDAAFVERFILGDGAALVIGTSLLALLTLLPFMYNQFASDGEGLAAQFLAPLSDRELVFGKALGLGLLLALSLVPCAVAAVVLAPATGLLRWLAVAPAILSIYALLAPLAAFMSMAFPRTADLSKLGSAGNAHNLAGFVGLIGAVAAAAPAALINGIFGTVLGSPAGALGMMIVWAALCVALSVPLLTGVARAVRQRRENLGQVARGQ